MIDYRPLPGQQKTVEIKTETEVTAAWHSLLAEAKERPWLMRLLRERGAELMERFVESYRSLLALGRQRRRALVRQAGLGLAGAAFFLALAGPPVFADGITVDGTCTLTDAITAANTDAATGSCSAGNGADTITLTVDVMLAGAHSFGNGLPRISSPITIDGSGHTISRTSGSPEFRIFEVISGGDLTLNQTTVSGGESGSTLGGGILNGGTVTVNSSTFTGNRGDSGGGIANQTGATLTVNNSTFSANTATNNSEVGQGNGGGIFNASSGTLIVNSSTFFNNRAEYYGGGISNNGGATLAHTLISGNTGVVNGPEISNRSGGTITANAYNLFGHSGGNTNQLLEGFTPASPGSDITATANGTNPTALANLITSSLANNGGPTRTHALVLGSPAINAIDTVPDCRSIQCRQSFVSGKGVVDTVSTGSLRSSAALSTETCIANTSVDQRGTLRANGSTTGAKCDIGSFEYASAPTAVTIASFSSQTTWGTGPQLVWETGNENGLSGFHIWRGTASAAETRLTDALIGASGGLNGGEYTWQDSVAYTWGQRSYYWLEAVNADGSSSFTGPVEVLGLGKIFLPVTAR